MQIFRQTQKEKKIDITETLRFIFVCSIKVMTVMPHTVKFPLLNI